MADVDPGKPPAPDPLAGYRPDWRQLLMPKDPLGLEDPLTHYTPDWRGALAAGGQSSTALMTQRPDVASVDRSQLPPDRSRTPVPTARPQFSPLAEQEQATHAAAEQAAMQKPLEAVGPAGRIAYAGGRKVAELANLAVQGVTGGKVGVMAPQLQHEADLEQQGVITPGHGLPHPSEEMLGSIAGTAPAFLAGEGLVEPAAEALQAAIPRTAVQTAALRAAGAPIESAVHSAAVLGLGSGIAGAAERASTTTDPRELAKAGLQAGAQGVVSPWVLVGTAAGSVGPVLNALSEKLAAPGVETVNDPAVLAQARTLRDQLGTVASKPGRSILEERQVRTLTTQGKALADQIQTPAETAPSAQEAPPAGAGSPVAQPPQPEPPAAPQPQKPGLRQRVADLIDPQRAARAAQLEDELRGAQRTIETDPLTGVGSPAAWKRALPLADKDAGTEIVTFDLNNLKALNDLTGHDAGNQAIVGAARAISEASQAAGVAPRVFRLGGDEFAALVPKGVGNVVRAAAEEKFAPIRAGDFEASLTGSVGDTFAESDRGLQVAKQQRKGAGGSYRTLTPEGTPSAKFKKLDDPALELRYNTILDRIDQTQQKAVKTPWIRSDAGWDSEKGQSTSISGVKVTPEAGRAFGRLKDDGRIAGELQGEMRARGIDVGAVHQRYFDHQKALFDREEAANAEQERTAEQLHPTSDLAHEEHGGDTSFDPSRFGGAKTKAVAALAGAGVGGTVGAQVGATPADRRRNALLGALAGLGLAYGVGRAGGQEGATAVRPEPGLPAEAVKSVRQPKLQLELGGDADIDPEEYVRVQKFPEAVRPEVEQAVRAAVARGDLPNPKTREPIETRRQTSETIVARDLATGHFQEVNTLSKQLQDPTLSDADRLALWNEIQSHRAKAQALTTHYVKAGTETARELNARKMLAQASDDPFTWYVEAQRQIGADTPLSDEVRARIDGFIAAKDPLGLHHYLVNLPKPGGALRAIGDMVVAGLISGPSVFLKAIGGGLTFGALEHAVDKVAAVGDAMVSSVFGLERSTVAWKSGMTTAAVRGYVQGLKNGWEQVRGRAVRDPLLERLIRDDPTNAARWSRYFQQSERHYDNPILEYGSAVLSRPATRAHGIYFNLLARGPMERSLLEQAHTMATNAALKGLDYTNRVAYLVEHPTDEMALRALEQSQYASLRNRGLLARIGGAIKHEARDESPAAGLAATMALPIVGVPANALARTLEYAGGGIATGTADLMRLVSRSLAEGTVGVAKGLEGRELSSLEIRARMLKRFARGGLGGGLLLAGYKLAEQGLMTGPYPDDPGQRAAWIAAKRRPWSLKIGNTWHNVAAIIPVGPVLALGAGLYHYTHDQYAHGSQPMTPGQRVAGVAGMPVRLIAEQPFLSEPKAIAEAATQGGASASKVGANVATAAIPYSGLLRQTARATDPFQRAPQGAAQTIRSVLPGLSRTVPARVDVMGRTVTQPTGLKAFDPTQPTAESRDPVLREILRLGYAPTLPKQYKGEPQASYVARQQREGQLLHQIYGRVMVDPGYTDREGFSYPQLRALENQPGLTPEQQAAIHERMVGILRSAETTLRGTFTRALKARAAGR